MHSILTKKWWCRHFVFIRKLVLGPCPYQSTGIQCTLSSSEHWLSAPCLHKSIGTVHPAIIKALLECNLSSSQFWFSASCPYQSTITMHQVLITALFLSALSSLKHWFSAFCPHWNTGSVHSVLIEALGQCILSSLKHWFLSMSEFMKLSQHCSEHLYEQCNAEVHTDTFSAPVALSVRTKLNIKT